MKIETNNATLKQVIALAEILENPDVKMSPSEFMTAITELHYKTRVFCRPVISQIKNENL